MSFSPTAQRSFTPRRSKNYAAMPSCFNAEEGGQHNGVFHFEITRSEKQEAECKRDFLRAWIGGGVAVLSPMHFDALSPWATSDVSAGDVSDEAMTRSIAEFREQILESTTFGTSSSSRDGSPAPAVSPGPTRPGARARSVTPGEERELFEMHKDVEAKFMEIVNTGAIEPHLTVGPAMQFALDVGLAPRILQPRFVVVLGIRSLRIATIGFVGEPLIGDRPSEQRTPFVVRLLTQNLLDIDSEPPEYQKPGAVRITYFVRRAEPRETSIDWCVSTEVGGLLDTAMNRMPSFTDIEDATPVLLVSGVVIPPDGVEELEEATFFSVRVEPADGRTPWEVRRRYQHFHELFCSVRPKQNELAGMAFPRKHLRACVGSRLEARRRGLEIWLNEVVRESQTREPGWRRPVYEFLEVR